MSDFTFYTPETAPAAAKPILEQIEQAYGFIPNLFAYMAEAPTTLEAYLTLNELVAKTSFSPAQQQIALLAASVQNQCEFCTVAHRAMGKMNHARQQTLDALHQGEPIEHTADAALAAFTQQVVQSRGRPGEAAINTFLNAGYSKQQVLEVMLIVSIKTLSNYINHLTNPQPNAELLGMITDRSLDTV